MSVTPPEIEGLYRAHAPRLNHAVEAGVGAPAATIEDACQVAWSRLFLHRQHIHREAAFSWLTTTAVHEALRATHGGLRECSLEEVPESALAARLPSPAEGYEPRERLRELRRVPVRERRILWLRGLGFSYAEIAAREGCSERAIERALDRARKLARAAA
jgi:RNA polymerase sigma factor (sigma-70 family)